MTPQDATVITFYTVLSSIWMALTSDGFTPWAWSIFGVVTWSFIQPSVEANKGNVMRLLALSCVSVVIGVFGALKFAKFSDAPMFPFIVAIVGCELIKLMIDKDMQKALKDKAISLVKKSKP